MFEKIENILNKKGRKQRGKKTLKKRVNITYPISTLALFAKINKEIKLEEFKQIKSDLTKLVNGLFKIVFTVAPNKTYTKKGILVRMGKGKGKIDHFSYNITSGTIFILLVPKSNIGDIITGDTVNNKYNFINKFIRKYPYLAVKYFG